MPKNVQEALRYVGKVGMLTRKTWNNFFGQGKIRWQQYQLHHLVSRKVLKKHSCRGLSGVWVLDDPSIEILNKLGLSCVYPIPPQYIEHDEVVANSILTLERNEVCQRWSTERELRMLNVRKYLVQNKDKEIKYPDAIFDLLYEDVPVTFALEYEKTGKTSTRYRSILRSSR